MRSTDDGRTWNDATHLLPIHGGVNFLDAWFPDTALGLVAVANFFLVGPATLFTTNDAAVSWHETPEVGGLHATDRGAFGYRGGHVELMLGGAGTSVLRIDDGVTESIREMHGLDYATVERRGWIAGSSQDSRLPRPVVYSAEFGSTWTAQALPFAGSGDLRGIDFLRETGVTCGVGSSDGGTEPLCFWTSDGGTSWRKSEMPETARSMTVWDVVRCGDSNAWAVAESSQEDRRIAFLQSTDSGATWREVDDLGNGLLRALARVRSR